MNSQEDQPLIADILIVDDKLENIRLLSDFLSKQQYQVRKAINGQAALNAVKALPPDLILLDINMPKMGGYEVCTALKKDPQTSSIAVIFLSAGNQVSDKVQAFQVGGIDYITKPFQLEEVLLRVQTQLKLQYLQKQLKCRNEELQNALRELQTTQAQLVQKEKLANAGRISAGVSHEINNPLNFILGNLTPTSEYSQKLIKLVQLYQQTFPDGSPEINQFIEEIELDFLVSDLTKLINSLHKGAKRISSVVQALHVFSRFDESGNKPFDIRENIDSVLVILRYQLLFQDGTQRISVLKNYEDVPRCLGYANLFNQAIFNLLQNAIDALDSRECTLKDSSFQPTIWIDTRTTEQQEIRISIKDNGIGISQEHEAHLFEPFFTTKLVGQGVGLGLFASSQVITEIHKGRLTYYRCPDGGSEFVIEIPIESQLDS
jgi:signal transduction histidine kinase